MHQSFLKSSANQWANKPVNKSIDSILLPDGPSEASQSQNQRRHDEAMNPAEVASDHGDLGHGNHEIEVPTPQPKSSKKLTFMLPEIIQNMQDNQEKTYKNSKHVRTLHYAHDHMLSSKMDQQEIYSRHGHKQAAIVASVKKREPPTFFDPGTVGLAQQRRRQPMKRQKSKLRANLSSSCSNSEDGVNIGAGRRVGDHQHPRTHVNTRQKSNMCSSQKAENQLVIKIQEKVSDDETEMSSPGTAGHKANNHPRGSNTFDERHQMDSHDASAERTEESKTHSPLHGAKQGRSAKKKGRKTKKQETHHHYHIDFNIQQVNNINVSYNHSQAPNPDSHYCYQAKNQHIRSSKKMFQKKSQFRDRFKEK